ncbi:MAG: RelA/SpoT family protein, partial [Minisyncoccales bacterium]
MSSNKNISTENFNSIFINTCKKNNYNQKDIDLFKKAIGFAEKYLEKEKRLCGEKNILHNLEIGRILAENKLFPEVIAAGILYSLEKKISYNEIEKEFGKDIAEIVFGQINLRGLKEKNKSLEAEILRKIILTTLSDVRIIFVKLANKLANLKTLDFLPLTKQKKISKEAMEIYAPLAGRLGLYNIKKDIEDNAFFYIKPKKYQEIKKFLEEYQPERERFMEDCLKDVSETLKKNLVNKDFYIKGREKHIYSIYKKISERKIPLNKQRDHFAIRVIANTIEECYNILGVIYENYEPVQGTFKDYISNPKPNGYKSIHSIILFKNKEIEVQIRTKEMDEFAEEGPAAHWAYKGIKSDQYFEKKVGFLKSLLDLQLTQKEEDFLRNIKIDLFGEEIYCYTPKGKLITLPKNSTVLDFAYHIHQEIGDKTVAARINGNFVSLKKELKSGDIVEVITNKNQRPHREWLRNVVSSRARSAIRKGIKKYEKIAAPSKIQLKKEDKDVYDPLVYSEDLNLDDREIIFAKCCSSTPKEDTCGVIKSNKKILVHNKNCSNLNSKKDNVIPLLW